LAHGGRIEVGNTADFVVLETSWDGLRQMLGRGERFDGVRVSYTVKAGKRTEQ
jgi:predicted amidohydrolase YtcJ